MKFEISFERVFPHSPRNVWQSLIDPAALGEWLMETDLVPEVGRDFKMWCDDGAGGTDTYLCKMLEYQPPKRMLWSWVLEGNPQRPETFVEIRVEPVAEGTKVTITHRGDRDRDTIEKFKGGWPTKLESLQMLLSMAPKN